MFLVSFLSPHPKQAIMLPQDRRPDQVKEVDGGMQMHGFVLIYFVLILAVGGLTFACSGSWLTTCKAAGATICLITLALFIWGAITTTKTGAAHNAVHDNDCDCNH